MLLRKILALKTVILFLVSGLIPLLTSAQGWKVSKTENLPNPVSNNAVCGAEHNGTKYAYSFGGIDSSLNYNGIHRHAYRVDLESNDIIVLPDLPDTMGKIAMSATVVGDTIYIIGGYHVFANGSEKSSNKVHRFSISSNKFLSDGPPIPVPIDDHVQVVYKNRYIYVVGGWSETKNVSNVQVFDTKKQQWFTASPLPSNKYKFFGASGSIIGNTIYYMGGASTGLNFPAKNRIIFGQISLNNAFNISWKDSLLSNNFALYRPASIPFNNSILWLGGSLKSYNFNAKAYDGSGTVSTTNKIISLTTETRMLNQQFIDGLPMDLRGVAGFNVKVYFLGGIDDKGKVSSGILELEYDENYTSIQKQEGPYFIFKQNNGTLIIEKERLAKPCKIEIFNTMGCKVISSKWVKPTYQFSPKIKGVYVVLVSSKDTLIHKKISIH